MTQTYTIRLPITTCAICGNRDWRHVSVLGAKGAYCRSPCAAVAIHGYTAKRAKHQAQGWKTGVFSPTPLWEPPQIEETPGTAKEVGLE